MFLQDILTAPLIRLYRNDYILQHGRDVIDQRRSIEELTLEDLQNAGLFFASQALVRRVNPTDNFKAALLHFKKAIKKFGHVRDYVTLMELYRLGSTNAGAPLDIQKRDWHRADRKIHEYATKALRHPSNYTALEDYCMQFGARTPQALQTMMHIAEVTDCMRVYYCLCTSRLLDGSDKVWAIKRVINKDWQYWVVDAMRETSLQDYVPFGKWEPRQEVHQWCPVPMALNIKYLFLMHNRGVFGSNFPRDIIFLLAGWICTRPFRWDHCSEIAVISNYFKKAFLHTDR